MTPSRFNRLNRIQTTPKPPSLMPVWFAGILFVVLMATLARIMWVYSHPESAKGGVIIHNAVKK